MAELFKGYITSTGSGPPRVVYCTQSEWDSIRGDRPLYPMANFLQTCTVAHYMYDGAAGKQWLIPNREIPIAQMIEQIRNAFAGETDWKATVI